MLILILWLISSRADQNHNTRLAAAHPVLCPATEKDRNIVSQSQPPITSDGVKFPPSFLKIYPLAIKLLGDGRM
jgi:hypothetical protein